MGTPDLTPTPRPTVDPDLPPTQRQYLTAIVGELGIMDMIRTGSMENWTRRRLLRYGPVAAIGVVLVALSIPAAPGLAQALAVLGALLILGAGARVWMAARTERDWRATADLVQSKRVITASDLDPRGRELLARAQSAADTVLASRLHEDGVLDRVHNKVLLPAAEWQLAVQLRELAAVRQGASTGVVEREVVRAEQAAVRQVAALESYAERVAAADVHYRTSGGYDVMGEIEDLTALAEMLPRGGDATRWEDPASPR